MKTNQQIIDDAPEGAEDWTFFVSFKTAKNVYAKRQNGQWYSWYSWKWKDNSWGGFPSGWIENANEIRSRKDIEALAEKDKRIAELELNQIQLLELIYNSAIGEIAMGYKVDTQYLAESAYSITGVNAEQLKERN